MNKFLSIIFLYNRASHNKLLLIVGAIPVCFLAIFLLKIGNPYEASPNMIMERAFGGIWAVLVFVVVNLLGILIVADSLNKRKSLKTTNATTGYTMRRLCISPMASFITIFIYYLVMILIFWAVSIASLYAIGKIGMSMAGVTDIETKLALGILRTEIGHALIPIANPIAILFNTVSILALASQCARSCYLSWHNGTPSAGVLLVVVLMLLFWANILASFYMLMAIIVIVMFGAFAFGDVISREVRPKGDPFKVNKYDGIMDFDSLEFDDDVYDMEVNSAAEAYGISDDEESGLERYGRIVASDGSTASDGVARGGATKGNKKRLKKIGLGRMRRRFMPLGISLEKANNFFGVCIFIGVAEHLLFFGKYMIHVNDIKDNIKGLTLESDLMMPYFRDLQAHTYYGYLVAILLALFLQAYWNYEYYNKKTKSVYVMKRLPDRKEYSRTIWIAPAMQAIVIVIIMVAHTAVDLCLYILGTPDIALYPDYMSHILPF